MQDWDWHEVNGIPYLICGLLKPWCHGFFTRLSWPSKPEQLSSVFQAAWPGYTVETYRTQQVHGNQVLWSDRFEAAEDEDFPKADGVLVDSQGLTSGTLVGGWVASADCTPVLMGDVKTGQVAALHAGWRGTAAQIVPTALEALRERGSRAEDLRVALGPAIAGSVYQVEQSVALQVCQTIAPVELTADNWVEVLGSMPDSPILVDPEPGKVRLDVRQVNRWQLRQWGLGDEQIAIAPYCTFKDSDRFFSYRRTGEKQVQWSGILTTATTA